jgi:hypothetical protein
MKKKLSKILGIALTIALLTSLLTVAAPAVAMTQPSVSLATIGAAHPVYEIDKQNIYTVTFTAGVAVPAGGQIVVTFPTNTDTTTLILADCTIASTAGIGGAGSGGVAQVATAIAQGLTNNILIITVPTAFGSGSIVQVVMGANGSTGIKNPPAANDAYTLTVATQTAVPVPIEAAVASQSYAIIVPTINPLPGVVLGYNSQGVLMAQSNSINTCIIAAGAQGRVEVGTGYYDEAININAASVTLVATGDAVVKDVNGAGVGTGTLTVTVAGTAIAPTVIDGLVFESRTVPTQASRIVLQAGYVTVKNCTISTGTASGIDIQAGLGHKIDTNTITASTKPGVLISDVLVAGSTGTISNNTISVGATGTAISSLAASTGAYTISGNEVTGASGNGISLLGSGAVTLTSNILSTLNYALTLNNAAAVVTATKNTVDACGSATAATNAIIVTAGTLNMSNNTVSNTTATGRYAISNLGTLTARFNNFLGNTLNIFGTGATANNVDHNWWGAATGPATGTMATAADPFPLGASASDGTFTNGAAALTGKATVGIDVAVLKNGAPCATGAGDIIGVSKLDTCPVSTAPVISGVGSVKAYYDISWVDATACAPDTIQIKIYDDSINTYTSVSYSGGLTGAWIPCSNAGVNVAGGYAYVIVTGTSTPNITELTGTPFALIEDKTLAAPALTVAAGATPAIGAYDIAIEPTFTWGAVAGAIRYEIALSEDPTFTIPEWSYNVDNNFFKADEALRYETTYYWRVRGVLGEPYQEGRTWITPATPWATGIFTTAAEPVEAATGPEITVEPVKPEVTVDIPPTKITVEPPAPAIPNYMLWIIVVVGAVLIIALIVLIVRTRRVV